jgi:hypothetical protein
MSARAATIDFANVLTIDLGRRSCKANRPDENRSQTPETAKAESIAKREGCSIRKFGEQ